MTRRHRHAGSRAQAVARALASMALGLFGSAAYSAWHDDHPGSGVAAHYVHLTGYATAVDVDRRNVIITQQACVDMKRALGKSATIVPAESVPRFVSTFDIEIYYGAERSLSVQKSRLVVVDPETCALDVLAHQVNRLANAYGSCDIDVKHSEAVGACNNAPIYPGTGPGRDLVISRNAETRTVAGVQCRVARSPTGAELCIADVADAGEVKPEPAAVRRAPLNGGHAGLLCASHSRAMTLTADEVRMNLSVAPSLFALPPPGVKVNPARRSP